MSESINIHLAFKTLNLEPGVSPEEIKKAYRKLAKECHPDRFLEPSQKLDAEERIKIINQAYEFLKNNQAINDTNSADTNSISNKQNIYSKVSNPETLYQRGMKKAQNRQYQEAIEDFTLAIRLDKNYLEAYKFRALACEKLGYTNRAKSDRRKVLDLEALKHKRKMQERKAQGFTDNYYDLEGFVHYSHQTNIESPWKIVKTINHENGIYTLDISPNGKFIASAGIDNTIKIWDFKLEKLLNTLTQNKKIVRCVAFSQDGQLIASGSDDGSIFIWQVETGKLINHIQVHSAPVYSVIISPDNQTILSSSGDTTIKISHINMGEMLQVIKAHNDSVYKLIISPNNKILVSCSSDKTIKLWQIKNRKLINVLAKHLGCVTTISISPDGQFLASGGSDKMIILWEINTGKIIKTLLGHHTHVLSLTFSPDSQFIASTSLDGTLKVWNAMTGEELYTVYQHSTSLNTVKFSPDSKSIISASNDGKIKVWQC
ncbi:MAG: DnaJ domain-containing protein [Calothrix sp. MO_192.B10]|nr:DnaJ domain-containing protein [Calothrix sp. MO_192.B10]